MGIAVTVPALLAGESAVGQELRDGQPEGKRGSLEEVVVTAQKREERLQDVPISVSVLGGAQLDQSTAPDVGEALSRVPGVTVAPNPFFGGSQISVRGVSAAAPAVGAASGGGATVGYYLDGLPYGFVKSPGTPDVNVYDLDRIEVLRGPQGTLYGASALNGVVRVLTHDAKLDEFQFKTRALVSSTEGGTGNYRGDMAVNVPIVDGKLAARAAVSYEDWGGWIDRPNKSNANEAQRSAARFKINAQPIDQLSIGLVAWLSESDQSNLTLADRNNNHHILADEPITSEYSAYGLKVAYDFPWVSVASTTSYLDYSTDMRLRAGTNFQLRSRQETVAQTFGQELLLTSTHEGAWRWSFGGMYRDSTDKSTSGTPGLQPFRAISEDSSASYAVFGELTRLFLDGRIELTAGLRYFEDDVRMRELSRATTGVPPEGQRAKADATFEATTPRLVLTWHPNVDSTVYASYSEGFRSGAHQDPSLVALVGEANARPVEPDTLSNYEVGAKFSLFDGSLNVDAAAYYIDWVGVQQRLLIYFPALDLNITGLMNGESASGPGFDLAVASRLGPLDLGVNFNWNHVRFDTDVFSGTTLLFNEGDRVNYSPEYSAGVSADYVFPFGESGFEGRFSASANYTSESPRKELRQGTVYDMTGDPLWFGRLSISLQAPDHWTASLFVDNVNNEQGRPQNLGVLPDARFNNNNFRLRPRTVGVQFDYHY